MIRSINPTTGEEFASFEPTSASEIERSLDRAVCAQRACAADADQAVSLANQTEYGLGCALWTSDLDRAKGLARRIQSGSVFINGMVASDPRLPFGGVKRSGYGRELGVHGMREFTNIRTVWIGPSRTPAAL